MTLDIKIADGRGRGNFAKVTEGNNLVVAVCDPNLRSFGAKNNIRFLSQLLDSTGDGTGTTNMNVDGSTAQTFYLRANDDFDQRIMKFVIYLQDGSITHAGFGALASLTNGFDVAAVEEGVTTYFVEKAKNFADLIEQTAAEAPFGDAARAFELDAVLSNEDALVLPMTVADFVPNGLRIRRGGQDVMCAVVNDDLQLLTELTVRAIGYKHFPG